MADIQAIERLLDEHIDTERPLVDGRLTVSTDSLREAKRVEFIFEGEVVNEGDPRVRLFAYRNPMIPGIGYLVSRDERSPCDREVSWRAASETAE